MKRLMSLASLVALTSLACVAPTPAPTLAELNSQWIGKTWSAYVAVNGAPQRISALSDGGQVGIYERTRTESGPRATREVVNVGTGERVILTPGANADTARQQWGPTAQTRVQDGRVSAWTFTCTTLVRVDAQGVIHKIERSGNDC